MSEAQASRANMGLIGAIVAVATIGGFLFGYDSGAAPSPASAPPSTSTMPVSASPSVRC
jgi:hypothetical protein